MQNKKSAYRITTDTMSDMPKEYLQEHGIETISLTYTIGDEVYGKENSLTPKAFFDRMREGAVPTSSQFNPEDAAQVFEALIEQYDEDILHLSFTSGLSGSYDSACAGAQLAMKKHPERRVVVVDTLCASLGQGFLLKKAVDLKEQKHYSLDELQDWVEKTKLHMAHVVTVQDLIYLYRGGRVSRTTAFVSGVLDIKPLIHLDNEGKLTAYGKVRGRKKALLALVDAYAKQVGKYLNTGEPVYICHGDCLEDAQFVADQLRERYGITEFLIDFVGPTIGLHTGPGVISIFFLGDYR